jgi:peptidoglycan/LPS O-acetylase OafA/YrhL
VRYPIAIPAEVPEGRHVRENLIGDIQIMRAGAILAVLFYHFSFLASVINHLPFKISNPLYSGVDLFFVISGFVVMRSLIRGGFDPTIFAIRRIFRLYPAILVFLMVTFVVNGFYRHVAGIEWARGFFSISWLDFFQSALAVLGGYYINIEHVWFYSFGAIWSLSVEFQFYAVVFLSIFILRLLRVKTEHFRKIFFVLAASVLGLCLYARGSSLFWPLPFFENYLINQRFDFLAMGAILAFLPQDVLEKWSSRSPFWTPFISLMAGWVALMFFRTPEVASRPNDMLMSVGMLISGAAFTMTIALLAGGERNRSLPPAVRSVLLYIGDRSYAIYLLHFPMMSIAWYCIYRLFGRWMSNEWIYDVLQIIFSLVLVFITTELTSRFIEQPAIALGAHLVNKLRQIRAKLKTKSHQRRCLRQG